MEYWGVMKTEPIESMPGKFNQRRETQEGSKLNPEFQRILDDAIRQATERYVYEPRPSINVGWENNDGLD